MRRFAQGLFDLTINIVVVIFGIMVGGIGAAIGFVIGLLIFGSLGLKGWVLGIPVLIVAGLGFVIGVLLYWGFFATVNDMAGVVGEAVGRKLKDDDGGGKDR
jgi:hypothetical protein